MAARPTVHDRCVHQHFDASPDRPARLMSAIDRTFEACGLGDLEQLEDAPEFMPGVALTAGGVARYLRPPTACPDRA
jgi:hypothetical protein